MHQAQQIKTYSIEKEKILATIGNGNLQLQIDNLNISAKGNGVIALLAVDDKKINTSKRLMLYAISEVKSTNSGWNKNEKFNWGKSPTLLKHIPLTITIAIDSSIKIYPLDDKGIRVNG